MQIQVDNLDTSDNTEDNSHTVMIVMMIIKLVIMMTAMLSPPGCNQLSGTTLQSWEGMLHCRAGRLAAWLTVQHQHHPFVKPKLLCFFSHFCLFVFFPSFLSVCAACSERAQIVEGIQMAPASLRSPTIPNLLLRKDVKWISRQAPSHILGCFSESARICKMGFTCQEFSERPPHAFLSNVFFGFWVAMAIMLKICVIIGIWELHQKWKEQMVCMLDCLQKYIVNCTLPCPTCEI